MARRAANTQNRRQGKTPFVAPVRSRLPVAPGLVPRRGFSVENRLDRLRVHNCNPRQSAGQWKAKCPVHGDKNRSV